MISYVGKEHYDGPRGSPEKRDRNYEIMDQYKSGKSYRQIAAQYDICHSRVGQIIKRMESIHAQY